MAKTWLPRLARLQGLRELKRWVRGGAVTARWPRLPATCPLNWACALKASNADPLRAAQHALAHPDRAVDWPELCQFARAGRREAYKQGRIAECYELMEQWHAAAEARRDRRVLDESAREMVWILEGWGRTEEARRMDYRRATEFDEQMMLPFG